MKWPACSKCCKRPDSGTSSSDLPYNGTKAPLPPDPSLSAPRELKETLRRCQSGEIRQRKESHEKLAAGGGSEDNLGSGFLGEAPKPRLLPKGAELPFLLPVCVPSSSPAVVLPALLPRVISDRFPTDQGRDPCSQGRFPTDQGQDPAACGAPSPSVPPLREQENVNGISHAGMDFISFISEPGGLPPSLHPEKSFTHFTMQRKLRWPNHLTRCKFAYG